MLLCFAYKCVPAELNYLILYTVILTIQYFLEIFLFIKPVLTLLSPLVKPLIIISFISIVATLMFLYCQLNIFLRIIKLNQIKELFFIFIFYETYLDQLANYVVQIKIHEQNRYSNQLNNIYWSVD